jgi:heme transport system substrate-binding protein
MMRRFSSRLAVAASLLLALASTGAAEGRTITDAAGRTVEVTDASRIVAIGGSVTEILFALGAGDRVIGVDQTSTFPAAARDKKNVGYMRALSPEGVLSLAPSLVIAIEGAGPPEVIEVLKRASVPLVIVPEVHDADGVVRKIRLIAETIGVDGEGLAKAVASDFAVLADIRARITAHRKAVFVLAIGGGTPIVAGKGTSAEAIMTLAGADNALTGMTGFKPAVAEATLAAEPDAVVIMADRDHTMSPDSLFALPAFAGTPAARARRLIGLPGLYLLGFGPRTAHAARDLAAALYPELKLPALPGRPWTGAGEGQSL